MKRLYYKKQTGEFVQSMPDTDFTDENSTPPEDQIYILVTDDIDPATNIICEWNSSLNFMIPKIIIPKIPVGTP